MRLVKSKLLAEIPGIIHGFTTRRTDLPDFGNVSPFQGDPQAAIANRAVFMREIGVQPEHLTLAFQDHGTHIHPVGTADRGAGALERATSLPSADGLVTDEPDLPLGVMTADCACILMADRKGRAVGALHAGWRGVFENMPGHGVQKFRDLFGIGTEDLVAWIGPTISGEVFEVGEEVWWPFEDRWGEEFLLRDPLRVDLPGLIRRQLETAGLSTERIENCGLCTFRNTNLFSHRRGETPNGRMMGVIMRGKE